jgi:hypothetical protein
MTKDEALKLALEALEEITRRNQSDHQAEIAEEAITAIKAALEANDEPWEQFYPEMGKPKLAYLPPTESPENACYIPPQRTWVGLTDIDYAGLPLEQVGLVRWAEAKLKAKNT